MNKDWLDISEDVLLDYLDGVLDAEARGRVEESLQRDDALGRALETLRNEKEALFSLGRDLRAAAPEINIADAVRAAIADPGAVSDPLEIEMTRLGESLRVLTPKMDLAATVAALLLGLDGETAPTPVERELVAVGRDLRAAMPRVNLVAPVVAALEKVSPPNVVSLDGYSRRTAYRRRDASVSWWVIAAAAAGLVLGLGLFLTQVVQPTRIGQLNIARREQPPSATVAPGNGQKPPAPAREGEPLSMTHVRAEDLATLSSLARPTSIGGGGQDDGGDGVTQAEFTVEDIVRAKQKALEGQADALAMLARWGALDPDEVRRLLAEGLLTPQQLAGMSRFLPEGEARDLLRQAIRQTPEDPALRLALAKSLMGEPGGYDEAQQQIAALREMSPDNALVHYMDAQLRFAMGDYPGALSMLEYASNLNSGSAYGLENAQNHSAALQAAGLPADLADTVAAFYAGTDEYGAVAQLRTELLGYGEYFESLGDYDAALAVYKGVSLLGQQMAEGASYTNEYLAGLDTQMAAIDAINALAELIEIPGGLRAIQDTYQVFVESLGIFMEYTNLLDGVVQMDDISTLLVTVNSILQTGDINYLQNLLR